MKTKFCFGKFICSFFFTSKYALVDVGLELQVEPIGHQVSSCFVHYVLPFWQHDEGTSDPFKRWK